MTILLYDCQELEERASRHLRVWKVWHTTLYVLAAIFGILNYSFLFETEQLVDNQCLFYPRQLAFHWVALTNDTDVTNGNFPPNNGGITTSKPTAITSSSALPKNATEVKNETIAQTSPVPENVTEKAKTVKRDASEYITTNTETTVDESNDTVITENTTHRLMLQTSRTLFPKEGDSGCQFAEYMPLLSATLAIVWATLFIICPGGGRTRSGLQQPWRILAPALLFALVMVILTGYSFTSTNGGLQAFCAAFQNYTNTTACSAVNPFLERSWNESWGAGDRISATRAASAGVWASWACAAALLLARCLAAPDFVVRRTAVHLVKDPQQKVTPFLIKQKSPRLSANSSPSKRDTASVKSEPTVTELVTASVEHEHDSEPTSLATTPLRGERNVEALEMTYNPQETRRVHY
uniref:Uncharacterized protein n=1 Tax=Pectinophora gossypiella TaxID=13191 RepID=A0A1E1W2A8_PECGO